MFPSSGENVARHLSVRKSWLVAEYWTVTRIPVISSVMYGLQNPLELTSIFYYTSWFWHAWFDTFHFGETRT
jgi:hypothetical protein